MDLIVAETMINIEETLAAVDACQSVASFLIICTVTVEADGSIFSGGNAIEAAMSLEAQVQTLSASTAVGPDQLVSVIRNIKENVSIPVIAKPNAGMPQIDDLGNAVYSMTPADFAGYMKVLVDNGASVMADAVVPHRSLFRKPPRCLDFDNFNRTDMLPRTVQY